MRGRRARSADPGIMVAELEGEVHEQEDPAGRAGEGQRRVEVIFVWSSRAVTEAELNARRPEGLPKIPDASPRKVERELDACAGDAPGDLPANVRVGGHAEAAGSRPGTEFWSEIRRDRGPERSRR